MNIWELCSISVIRGSIRHDSLSILVCWLQGINADEMWRSQFFHSEKNYAFPSLTLKSISDNSLGMEYLLFLQMPQIHGERHLLGMSW